MPGVYKAYVSVLATVVQICLSRKVFCDILYMKSENILPSLIPLRDSLCIAALRVWPVSHRVLRKEVRIIQHPAPCVEGECSSHHEMLPLLLRLVTDSFVPRRCRRIIK